MKKLLSFFGMIMVCLLLGPILMISGMAMEQDTDLLTTVPSWHTISLKIEGKGMVAIDEDRYSKSEDIPVQRHGQPKIQVQAAEGHYIKSVFCNQENVTHLVKKAFGRCRKWKRI